MSAMLISCEKERGREKDKQKAMKEYLAELCWPLFDETRGRKEGRKEGRSGCRNAGQKRSNSLS